MQVPESSIIAKLQERIGRDAVTIAALQAAHLQSQATIEAQAMALGDYEARYGAEQEGATP